MSKYYAIEITKIKNKKHPVLHGPYANAEEQKEEIKKMMKKKKEVYYLDSEICTFHGQKDVSVGKVLMIEGDLDS